MLCLPLIKQAKLIGVLYLENAQASHVFTPARVTILSLLSSAISLENANLYDDLQQTRLREERVGRLRRFLSPQVGVIKSFRWRSLSKVIAAIYLSSSATCAASRLSQRRRRPASHGDSK